MYRHQKQLFTKVNYKNQYIEFLIKKSISRNSQLNPLERISLLSRDNFEDNIYHKFSTYQKLYCLISLSGKVPNKKFHFSRFFFNKQLNNLVVANTLK